MTNTFYMYHENIERKCHDLKDGNVVLDPQWKKKYNAKCVSS